MNEFISKNRIFDLIHAVNSVHGFTSYDDYARLLKDVEASTNADVQPVKRGKWCPPLMKQGKFATYCSRCHYTIMRNSAGIFEETPFCPHCGSDMRGDTND